MLLMLARYMHLTTSLTDNNLQYLRTALEENTHILQLYKKAGDVRVTYREAFVHPMLQWKRSKYCVF
jgi:hypothetical protein